MGGAHLSCISTGEIKNLTVTAVCDTDAKKLEIISEKHPGLELFNDYRELVLSGNVDSVLVAVPHPIHAEISAFALKNGLHVLSEKPIDSSYGAALKAVKEAEKSGKVFSIMFNQRTNSHFSLARKLVREGKIGELKSARWVITNWFRTQTYYDSGTWRGTWNGEGGGVLMNQAPHNLDLFQWICGMPKSLTAFCFAGKHHSINVEDEATVFMEYENGASGLFITSTGEYPGTNRLEINGTLGRIVIEGGVFRHWELEEDEKKVSDESESGFVEIPFRLNEISEYSETAHRGILQNFTNAVIFGEELISPGKEGLNQLLLTNAAYLSQHKGNVRITLPINPDEYDEFLRHMQSEFSDSHKTKTETLSEGYNTRWQVRW